MQVINYSKSRENLAKVIDEVVDNDETFVITKNDKSVVVISLDEYNSWKATSYLLQSKNNASRLMKSIKEVESNHIIEKELLEDESN